MFRRRLDDLVAKNGILNFHDAPYTGQLFDINNGGLVENVYEVKEGFIVGESEDLLSLPKGGLRVDGDLFTYKDNTDDYAYYKGEEFTGVAYFFEGQQLVDESTYIGACRVINTREWHVSGCPLSVIDSSQTTKWYEDGSIERQSITKGDFDVYSFNTAAPNKLRWLTLTDQYSYNPSALETFGLAQQLVLDGNKIDDQVLAIIEQKEDFKDLISLRILDSVISDRKIANINLENIKDLDLSDNKYITIETLLILKDKYPHCTICADDKYL